MSDDKLKKLKRWSKTEVKKASLQEKVVWGKILRRIEYHLHQK